MENARLEDTAQALVAPGKGIFAADVPPQGLINGFWGDMREPKTIDAARDFQEMMFRTPGLSDHISGIIIFDDVLEQKSKDGNAFLDIIKQRDILAGITPTTGWQKLGESPKERVPTGLDGLPNRLEKWQEAGISFVKWRVAARIGPGLPSPLAIKLGAHSVAEYAALAQAAGLVPIVEPDVEMRGEHDMQRHFEVTEWFLHKTFEALYEHGVLLEGIVLKTNMVLSGSDCPIQANEETVALETLKCLRHTVPPAVPGIAFLSGGQSDHKATAHLNAINAHGPQPWQLSFSYGRAIGKAAMMAWDGRTDNSAGQTALLHRARMNGLATLGKWAPKLEKPVSS